LTTWTTRDNYWQTKFTHTLIDCTFRSREQVDNRPWLRLGWNLDVGGSLTFKNSVKGRVSDQEGNPLIGAQVTIKDALDNVVFDDTTDSNGKFDARDLTTRVLSPTEKVVGVQYVAEAHEDTLVADGWLERTWHTPHTLTIEKAGYQTYKDLLEVDRKMELEVALGPFVPKNKLDVEIQSSPTLEVELFARRLVVELSR
jgi:hypothetical protein